MSTPANTYVTLTDGSPVEGWSLEESRALTSTARRMFADHGHAGYWDDMTRDACGACALNGWRASDDDGAVAWQPNYAGWERIYVQSRRPIPVEYLVAFMSELAGSDNARYRDCLLRDVATYGVRFAPGR